MDDFPNEVLSLIFLNLDGKSAVTVLQVCKHWFSFRDFIYARKLTRCPVCKLTLPKRGRKYCSMVCRFRAIADSYDPQTTEVEFTIKKRKKEYLEDVVITNKKLVKTDQK
jgi:hypothetical protein